MASEVVSKVQKLLALSSSPEPEEAQQALLAAQRLMAEHNLSMADVDRATKREIVMRAVPRIVPPERHGLAVIAHMIAIHHGCATAAAAQSKGGVPDIILIIGVGGAPDVCVELCKYAFDACERAEQIQCRRLPTESDKEYADRRFWFEEGFASALAMEYGAQEDKYAEWGLVLSQPPEVREYIESLPKCDAAEIPVPERKPWYAAYHARGYRAGRDHARGEDSKDGKE